MTLSNGVEDGRIVQFPKQYAVSQQQKTAYDQISAWNSEIPEAVESSVSATKNLYHL
jgi:hypothetical protein